MRPSAACPEVSMMYVDDDPPRPPAEGRQWACGPFGFWPLTFPWGDGVSWGSRKDRTHA